MTRPRAIILDVDGTLYDQRPLRLAMAWRLGLHCVRSPAGGLAALRTIRAYRQAQETLRFTEAEGEDLEAAQIRLACEHTGFGEPETRAVVDRWMARVPLPLLRRHLRPGVVEFLQSVVRRGLRTGVFSDYPARQKLQALGLEGLFEVVVCAQDGTVGRFKPDPRGLRLVAQSLGVEPAETIYVADRPDIDAPAAAAAGMACVIVGGADPGGSAWLGVRDFHELTRLIDAL